LVEAKRGQGKVVQKVERHPGTPEKIEQDYEGSDQLRKAQGKKR